MTNGTGWGEAFEVVYIMRLLCDWCMGSGLEWISPPDTLHYTETHFAPEVREASCLNCNNTTKLSPCLPPRPHPFRSLPLLSSSENSMTKGLSQKHNKWWGFGTIPCMQRRVRGFRSRNMGAVSSPTSSLRMDSCTISKLMTQQPSETQPYPATSRNPSCGVRLCFTWSIKMTSVCNNLPPNEYVNEMSPFQHFSFSDSPGMSFKYQV